MNSRIQINCIKWHIHDCIIIYELNDKYGFYKVSLCKSDFIKGDYILVDLY